jgi:Rrf2 family protein
MFTLSRKMQLALEAVVDVAFHARPDPVQSKDITRRQGIPQRYLEQVMQRLVHAGILKGVRGPRGGYRLARERRRISVGEILEVVHQIEQAEMEEGACPSDLAEKIVRPMMTRMSESFMIELSKVTLEDLCKEASEKGLQPEKAPRMDFNI